MSLPIEETTNKKQKTKNKNKKQKIYRKRKNIGTIYRFCKYQ